MKKVISRKGLAILLSFVLLICSLSFASTATVSAAGTTYYIDPVSGNDSNSGTSISLAWRTWANANTSNFQPGDQILLKRGTTINGCFMPICSGTSSASYLRIADYGAGSKPIINAGTEAAGIYLYNQEYWVIENLEITGGKNGILIYGDTPNKTFNFYRVNNVTVHDTVEVNGSNATGIFICFWFGSGANVEQVNDVIVDGCTVYNVASNSGATRAEADGIAVLGTTDETGGVTRKSNNLIVRNSTAYNTGRDGITVMCTDNGYIQNCVTYNTGLGTPSRTPNGIWVWDVDTGAIQNCEAYNAHSPSIDGGGFDIDYHCRNVSLEYSYAHDNDAYGASFFGADNVTMQNPVIRYNIFSNNGREAGANGCQQGDIYSLTWNGGSISGAKIYNNTSYWNPADADAPAVKILSDITGSIFKNNIVYSTSNSLVKTSPTASGGVAFDYNNYWYTGITPRWIMKATNDNNSAETIYTSLNSWTAATGQDSHSLYQNPGLSNITSHANGMPTTQFTILSGSPLIDAGVDVGNAGSRDFLGNTIPRGNGYDIGACESPYTSVTPTPAPNLITTNPGFETGNANGWSKSGTTSIINNNTYSGAYAASVTGSESGYYRTITGLQTNTTYTLTAYGKLSSTGQSSMIYAKNFGGTTTFAAIGGTTYSKMEVKFTTGATNTSVEIGVWKTSGSGTTYADDFYLRK